MFENALYNLVRASSYVNALVTDPKGVAFSLLPTGTKLPAVVIHIVSSSQTTVLERTTELVEARVQFDCYATSYSQSRQLAKIIKDILADGSGDVSNGDSPETFTHIQACIVNNNFDMPVEQGGAGKGLVFRAVLDMSIWFNDQAFAVSGGFTSGSEVNIDDGIF